MADVFISYSKSHPRLTQDLARELESKGVSVWWDTALLAGESYRQRIMEELKACKAAIVIWTPESIASDYVQSEAERARLAGKLLQARTADVDLADLPPPFDTSHVPLIGDRRAIFGGLAKLGILKNEDEPVPSATALYTGSPGRPPRQTQRVSVIGLAALALSLALGGALLYRPAASTSGGATLEDRGTAMARTFVDQLNSGLASSSFFAPEVRLGRRGLMTNVEAVSELRKLHAKYSKTACRAADGKPAVKATDNGTPFRVAFDCLCDFTDKAGGHETERFRLEMEVTKAASGDVISGLWTPDKMVLWEPRAQ